MLGGSGIGSSAWVSVGKGDQVFEGEGSAGGVMTIVLEMSKDIVNKETML